MENKNIQVRIITTDASSGRVLIPENSSVKQALMQIGVDTETGKYEIHINGEKTIDVHTVLKNNDKVTAMPAIKGA